MITINSDTIEVVKIESEVKEGFTAPLTQHGTILVNDILVSCYSEINSHWLAHLAMKPVSMWYQITKYIGTDESADSEGLNSYASILYDVSSKVMPSLFT